MSEYRTLLVPYDFSEHARAALAVAVELAGRLAADLHLLHVIQTPVYATPGYDGVPLTLPGGFREVVTDSLRQVVETAGGGAPRPIVSHVIEGANIAESITRSAEELGADLIVMGTHGRSGLLHALLGSVAERTLRRASCPVLTVRAKDGEASEFPLPKAADEASAGAPASECMETLTSAIERLASAGFRDSFQARDGSLFSLEADQPHVPEELVVREIVRFEGESDPSDSAVLFALRSRDGKVCGTFVAGYGAGADAESASATSRLEANHASETRGREHLPSGSAPSA